MPGPDGEHRRGRGSARAIASHSGAQLRHRARHDRRVEVGQADAAQLEQVAQRGAELVGRGVAHGGEAPVLDELAVAIGPEVGLGVADVDDEEHGIGSSPCRRSSTSSTARTRAPPCSARWSMKAVPYKVVELLPPMHAAMQRAALRRAHGARADARVRREALRLAGDHAPPGGAGARARRCFPADPDARAAVERAEEWGDEVWQPMARRLLWRTLDHAPARDGRATRRARAAALPDARRARAGADRQRASSAGSTAPTRAPCAPTCARCPATSTASTAGSPTACSAARRSTPPTCRSPRPRG